MTTTPWSPEITFGGSVAYRFDLAIKRSLTLYGRTYYSDEYNTSNLLAIDPAHQQESYTKTDVRLIWTSPGHRYAIELFIENIEDNGVLARGSNSDDLVQTSYLYSQNYGLKFRGTF